MEENIPEPGEIENPNLGVPGPAVPLPDDDNEHDEPTEVNDDDE